MPLPDLATPINILEWDESHQLSEVVIAVSVRNIGMLTTQLYEEYMNTIAKVCDYFIEKHNAAMIFIPQCCYTHGNSNEDDRKVARIIRTKMQHWNRTFLVEKELTVEECLSLYRDSTFALCTRLHGNVFAAMNGVPSIAINYNPKVKNFMTWLGQSQLVLNLDELDVSLIINKAEYIIKNRSQMSEEISGRVQEGHKQVQRYAYIACDLLNK